MPGTTDTVKAMLTPGEFVIRKEAVDMIGVPILEKLNDMPEAGGHSEIDRLIAKATLKNMTGMYGGGMVNAKQYMGGGKVDMYGHGGKVKNQMMMSYEHGGEAHGNLKPVPDDNPGLAKLPEKVRNKMGYMQDGGMAYIDPVDSSIVVMSPEQSKMFDKISNNIEFPAKTSKKYRLETLIDILNNPDLYGMNKKDSSLLDSSVKNMELEFYKDILEPPKAKLKEDSLMGMMYGGKAKKKKKYGYQEGGAVQDDAMMQNYLMNRAGMEFRKSQAEQANPFVTFDQRPPSSGEVMSPIPSGMEQGDMMRIIRDEREVLDMQDVELLRQKAQNALTRFQLDSLMQKATLDSLINQGSGDAMRIQRSPNEPFSFPNTPAQENFMQKYKEEMIDPTYFPEGN